MDVSIIMISLAMACAAFILTMAHATNGMDVMAKFQVAAAGINGVPVRRHHGLQGQGWNRNGGIGTVFLPKPAGIWQNHSKKLQID